MPDLGNLPAEENDSDDEKEGAELNDLEGWFN